MAKSPGKTVQISNYLCAGLMLVLIILQFTPFWRVDGETVSIASYIWFPGDHTSLTGYFSSELNGYSINDIVSVPILQLLIGAAGIVLCIIKAKEPYTLLIPAFVGGIGIWGFLAKPVYRLGSYWALLLVLSILLAAVAVAGFICYFAVGRRERKKG